MSPEQQEALEVLRGLCGGHQYVTVVRDTLNWIEVQAVSSDDDLAPRLITVGIDGRISRA